jgi:hypothetical protein
MKNGTRPTFRQWKQMTNNDKHTTQHKRQHNEQHKGQHNDQHNDKHTTQHNGHHMNQHQLPGNNPIILDTDHKTEKEGKLKQLVRPIKTSRIKTIKYRLGKLPNRRVAILIKNNQTRKRVQGEHLALKKQTILEVKNYLRKKNLLKAGSDAPADVLRQMYEQSVLAGDVENISNDALLHNFFSTD